MPALFLEVTFFPHHSLLPKLLDPHPWVKEVACTPGQEITLLASCAYWLSMLTRLVCAPFVPCYGCEAGEALAFMIIFLVLSQLWQSFKQLSTLVTTVV